MKQQLCECGCAQPTNIRKGKPNRFIHNHHGKGKRPSIETVRKISIAKLAEKNSQWKGDKVEKSALHEWVRNHLFAPKFCENCNTQPPYDLANITGIYNRDFSNWKYLCRTCHMLSDGRMNNLKQFRWGKWD